MRPLRETIRLITLAIRVASRDLRAQSSGFVWYALALGLGMGAMMAISSFRDHMADAYRARAKALLGADLAIRTRRALSETARSVLAQVPGRFADEVQFRTMAWFPESERARFVQVRAIGPGYPFFGAIETEPPDAAHTLHEGPHALVEENALIQSGGGIGSRVRVGSREFIVSGILRRAPGESPSEALIAPRIYIAHDRTGETGLLQPGSIVSYRRYFALPSGSDPEAWADRLRNELAAERPEVETAASRARALLGASDPIARYLGLVGFAALLLGSAGSAAAARLYLTRRIQTLAMIKCIGAPPGFAETVFLAQSLALCATGVLAGVFLSLVVLPAISTWMQGVLAVEVNASLRPGAVAEAGAAGAIFCMGFAALPLDSVRRLSPAQALRHGFELAPIRASAPARFITALGLAAAAALFTVWQTGSWARGLGIASAAAAGCIALGLVARALRVGARSLSGRLKWTAARHALAGMDRPYSSAGLLMIVLGAGSALLALLLVAEHSLRRVLSVYREPDQPTIVLIDVQPDQQEAVAAALEQAGLPPLYQTPIVAMRIDELRRRTARGGKREPARDVPEWALRREYRATYRGTLFPTERVIDGRWIDRWDRQSHPPGAAVPISIERSIADTLGLRLGDQVVWDLQGERMVSFIASVREVDWRSMKPNFYIVFPEGAIDRSPKTWALFARTTDPYGAAKAQKLAAERFPNVSVIDLALVLSSVNEVLAGLADAVRGIAWFVVGAGFLVMAGAVRASREQRAREYALLRALGAPLRHLATSWGIEYASVGLFGGLVGTGVGALGGAAASQFLLKVDPAADPLPLVALPFTLAAATALVGLLAGRGNGASPLECLRRSDV